MSGFALKLIAIICMTIDHLYKLMPDFISMLPDISIAIPGGAISLLGIVALLGRMAFPLFAFCVAEGALHTKNIEAYLTRLFIFAVISELPFDYAFFGGINLGSQNVIWTFFFGVLAVYLYKRLKSSMLIALYVVLATAVVCYLFKTDYNTIGVILIFVMYVIKNKPLKIFAVLGIICAYYLYVKGLFIAVYSSNAFDTLNRSLSLIATSSSVIFMALYNGRKGVGMKWFFYIYYPLHLIALSFIDKLWF